MHPVFTPVTLRTMTVKNRIARSATHDYVGNETGYVSDLQADIWEELAQNDLGLFITGHLYVDVLGQASASQNALDHDRYIPALASAVKRVQRHGCKVVAQLSHAGAKATPEVPLASSAITLEPGAPARAMTGEEIGRVVAAFAAAAGRAQAAGCDGVQIHCAHLYLLSQFITPCCNHRSDEYGGSRENRFRIVEEVLAAVRARCGEDYPVFVKINSNAPEGDEEYAADLPYMMERFAAWKVEAVEFSGCDFYQRKGQHNYYLERAAQLRKAADQPVMLVGGVRTLEDMAAVLDQGIEMVSLCRPFIRQADLIPRLRAGEGATCVSCGQCSSKGSKPGQARCIFNRKVPGAV
ncbi:NADH:flavin oxidoreductase [bacterium 210820-DFI.6.52]|nr:NADH:flavin oxidoreductase [bacterium 210820-DFI.6.52]